MIKNILAILFFFTIVVFTAQAQTTWVETTGSSYSINSSWINDHIDLSTVESVYANGVGTNWTLQQATLSDGMFVCNSTHSYKKSAEEFCFLIKTKDGKEYWFPEVVRLYNNENPNLVDPRLPTGLWKMNQGGTGSNFTGTIRSSN